MLYRFDSFEVDSEKFELRKDGVVQHVEPLVFDLIHYLVQNPDRVLTRDEIIDEIWDGRIVSETTISSCVKSARKALGDSGENQKYIRTNRGRGFQFLSKVNISDTSTKSFIKSNKQKSPRPALIFSDRKIASIIIGLLLIIIASMLYNQRNGTVTKNPASTYNSANYKVAVLPFIDMSPENNQGYFGDGIAEEILNVLTSVNGLNVTSRTTAFSFREQNLSVPEIAEKLNVNYIVEGSVRSDGDKIRITTQLIDVSSDTHLWSESYDRELNDIFAIQDEISAAITNALRVELPRETIAPTKNMEAYTLYLKGHQLFMIRGADNLQQAIKFFEQAIALDPNFAEAWADLSASYNVITSYGVKLEQEIAQQKALNAANEAITLKPTLAQSWAVKGYINLKLHNWKEARADLLHATELDTKNETAWMWLGSSYTATGFFEPANNAYTKAVEIAPNSALNHGNLGRNKLMLMDVDGAQEAITTSKNMGWWPASIEGAVIAIINRDQEKVIAEYATVLNEFGQPPNDNLTKYVEAYFDKSLKDEASLLIQEDLKKANLQAILGSLLLLDGTSFIRYIDQTNLDTITVMAHLFRPPFRQMLNQQPVKDFLVQIGMVDYWKETGWPDFCSPLNKDDFICHGVNLNR